jgi:hypothetical protein
MLETSLRTTMLLEGRKRRVRLSFPTVTSLNSTSLKLRRESETRVYSPPQRLLEIARDHIQLQRFFDLYRDKDVVSVDIEVTKSIPFCIGFAFNEWHAMSVPLLGRILAGKTKKAYPITSWQRCGVCVLNYSHQDIKVVGQNFKFDQRQLARLCGIYVKNFYCDTSLLAHSLHPEFPKALEFTTSIYTQ